MMSFSIRRVFYLSLILALFLPVASLNISISHQQRVEGLYEDLVLMPGEFVSGFIVAGFRGIAADLLWLKVDDCFHHGQYYKVVPLLRVITWLQRGFIDAWAMAGWHLAYNMAHTADDPDVFIREGIKFLKEGLSKNSDRYDLYFETGWVYYHRLKDYDKSVFYFKQAVMFDHPSYIDRLIAHAYRKRGDRRAEREQWEACLKLFPDEETHQEITKRFLKEF